ncbi:PadR family transcriptional regulator [Nocardia sp. alder85J]|uniref:PadR family transcriptional regulator n=1 Tax=Nocardia sp. alder85J TaxID=2862949 RepID=UPI001CD47187|nr:helix-turn-helix transcriptional regulator [Nocardia sp. alder85J]MCX4098378.1 helix-turn-helix transcriptional regulator [Nocardia sp. alder85J]
MKKTYAMVQVAVALLDDPTGKHWGYQLSKKSGVVSGVLHPILARMRARGWLDDGWEDAGDIRSKRPPRRYYVITAAGLRELDVIRRQAQTEPRFADIFTTTVEFA